jgi:hypothetical protein
VAAAEEAVLDNVLVIQMAEALAAEAQRMKVMAVEVEAIFFMAELHMEIL